MSETESAARDFSAFPATATPSAPRNGVHDGSQPIRDSQIKTFDADVSMTDAPASPPEQAVPAKPLVTPTQPTTAVPKPPIVSQPTAANPTVPQTMASSNNLSGGDSSSARASLLRRNERLRIQAQRAEGQRRIREERAAEEERRTKARSIAAKKAVITKRKQEAAKLAGIELPPSEKSKSSDKKSSNASVLTNGASRRTKLVVKLHYSNPAALPEFTPVDLEKHKTSYDLFWLRTNLREFLLRFDKLCRFPTRLTSSINNPLQPWVAEQFKSVILSLLKLIANDSKPLHARVRDYVAEIENLSPNDPGIWDWLLEFVEQLDAFAPTEVPTTEQEQLELVRRLVVVCTSTETIRITVMSDVEQLKWVEKDTQDEMKLIQQKAKDTQTKLEKLKAVDKEVYKEKLAANQRSMETKLWKAQQQLFIRTHKYNMRTVPIVVDVHGNKYWGLQYKSATQTAWGSWILCEMQYKPEDLTEFYHRLSGDVTKVLNTRDQMVTEKNNERKKQRQEERKKEAAARLDTPQGFEVPGGGTSTPLTDSTPEPLSNASVAAESVPPVFVPTTAVPTSAVPSIPTLPVGIPAVSTSTDVPAFTPVVPLTAIKEEESKQDTSKDSTAMKRRYPKLKISYPQRLPEPQLYYVEGRDNILQLASWVAGFRGSDPRATTEFDQIASYLSQT